MVKDATDRFTVHIPKDIREQRLLERLQEIAKSQRRSVSFMVVEAIREYLDRHDEEATKQT